MEVRKSGVKTLMGEPRKAVVRLSIPMMVSNLVFTLYSLADGVWVSGLGAEALSAVGIFFPIFMLFLALSMGVGVGTSSAIARKIGAESGDVNNVSLHALLLSLIVSAIVTSSYPFLRNLLVFIGAKGKVLELSLQYSGILVLGSVFLVFNNVSSGVMNGEGNTKKTMYANITGTLANVILDPIFIYILNFGISGAAYATVVSMAISSIIFVYWFFSGKTFVSPRFGYFNPDRKIVFDILRVGIPSSFSMLILSATITIVNSMILKAGGDDGIAVFTGAWRVVSLGFIPLFGMAGAVTSVVGAAFGAGNFEKMKTAYFHSIKVTIIAELLIVAAIVFLAPYVAKLFAYSQNSLRIYQPLVRVLQTLPLFLPFSPLGMMTIAMFQGMGRGEYALVITVLRSVVFQLTLAYFFAFILSLGFFGIVLGVVAGNVMAAMLSFGWGFFVLSRLRSCRI